jgi:hypothetical protein
MEMSNDKSKTERILILIFQHWRETFGSIFVLAVCWIKLVDPDRISNDTFWMVLAALFAAGFVKKRVNQQDDGSN